MTDGTPIPGAQPTAEQPALGADAAPLPPSFNGGAPVVAGGRPELIVGAAFAGGLVLARLLKRLAR